MTTTHMMTMLVLGIGIGACLGWMLGIIAGRQSMLRELTPVTPPDFEIVGSVIKPAAPEPTDWEDFEQRTNPAPRGEAEEYHPMRDRDMVYGLPRAPLGVRHYGRG